MINIFLNGYHKVLNYEVLVFFQHLINGQVTRVTCHFIKTNVGCYNACKFSELTLLVALGNVHGAIGVLLLLQLELCR